MPQARWTWPTSSLRSTIFKAYDIRGVYGADFDADTARRIAYFTVRHLGAERVVLSRDMRLSSDEIASAALQGIMDAGARCLDIGPASTPMNYFAVVHLEADAGIQITASHNPPEYNGFKISRRGAEPVGYDSGLDKVERLVAEGSISPVSGGRRNEVDVRDAYTRHVVSLAGEISPLSVVVDAANGMGGLTLPAILDGLPVKPVPLFFDLDGSFPNHDPNPLKPENLVQLCDRVRTEAADLGVAFDGDADRCVFVDESGRIIRCDLVTAIIGREMVSRARGGKVIYDVRSSRAVREEIEKAGGTPIREKVGHAFIKATMRRENALFGGELAGHYYFKDNFFVDSAAIAMVKFLEIISRSEKKVSHLVGAVDRYVTTGQINLKVEDKDCAIRHIAEEFPDGTLDFLDGITCDYPNWWFNVRKSNTEPLLRVVIEAWDEAALEAGKKRVLGAI